MTAYPFDRPVIILAAPRSGSTLLFETLAHSDDLWSIGNESHAIIEGLRELSPYFARSSNALGADDTPPDLTDYLRGRFLKACRDAQGQPPAPGVRPRLLEKTPKNALRIGFLDALFPDARYIYLYRNPRDNISSIIDGWESGRFVTYRGLRGQTADWSFLLPPGWEQVQERPVEEKAAFQWHAANATILHDLRTIADGRWTGADYAQLIQQPLQTTARLCDFCEISHAGIARALQRDGLALSRFTLTPPDPQKWQRNASRLQPILDRPEIKQLVDDVAAANPPIPGAGLDSPTT